MARKSRYSKAARLIYFGVVVTLIYIVIVLWQKSFNSSSNGVSSNFYILKANRDRNNKAKSNQEVRPATEQNLHDYLQPMEIVIEENLKFLQKHHIDETSYSQRKVIYLISTWRSGSTFFGEVFSAHPAVFYHYEPLARFGFQEVTVNNGLEDALTDLRYLSECSYEKLSEYMSFVRNDSSIFKFNEKMYSGCQYLNEDCYLPSYPSAMCNMFPIHLFKILRVKVSDLKPFLQDEHCHILLLLRDPRAVFASRRKIIYKCTEELLKGRYLLQLEWCTSVNRCINMSLQCGVINDDLSSINELQLDYPSQIHLARFEDVANQPVEEFKRIFNEIGIPWHNLVQDSIELHTKTEIDNPWTTYRISQTRVDKWRDELSSEMVSYIQDVCQPILDSVLYKEMDIDF